MASVPCFFILDLLNANFLKGLRCHACCCFGVFVSFLIQMARFGPTRGSSTRRRSVGMRFDLICVAFALFAPYSAEPLL